MRYKKIGDCIKLVSNRNKNLTIVKLMGVNITKNFMPSVANTSGLDLSKYKVIKKGQFATNIMHVDRDGILPVALYEDESPAIVSPAYMTFEVIDVAVLLPEFLMMQLQTSELDRRAWTYCDSSVRGGLEWARFCEIQIPIPDTDDQQKFVALYKGLLTNQKTYEKSLLDLQLICDTYIENLIKTEKIEILKEYIEQSEERNTDLKNENLLGISVNKIFIPTRSQKEKLDLSNYKIVRPREFGYVSVTSRNGEKISIAILDAEAGLVSSTYTVFRVKDISKILPEYLFLWFARPEFDRYARFHSWGSARETFDWADMCNVQLPIPDIKIQEAIVTIYHTLETRKRINEQLINTIKPLCPVLMKGVVENYSKPAIIEN